MCNREGTLGIALLGVGLLEGFREHTCCGTDTVSVPLFQLSVHTWKMAIGSHSLLL